jgi:polar amino acid transport system substrate-binding protein
MLNKHVGTLKGALAERILQKFNDEHGNRIAVTPYDDQNPAYEDLAIGRLDAVLMDQPIALYCADPARLKDIGEPLGFMQYGIALDKNNTALKTQIDAALLEVIRTGKARDIYQKWGLWNDQTKQLFASLCRDDPGAYSGTPSDSGPELDRYRAAVFQPLSLRERLHTYWHDYLPILVLQGAPMTLEISIIGMAIAIALGLTLAVGNLYGPAPVRWLARGYIEAIRGTPLLIQLYLIYYGLPRLGLDLPPFFCAIIGLGFNYGAYEAENYRAGIQAIPRGQMEAAFALGMTRWQALRHVILPQALRLTIPPVTNDFVALLKDSSIVSIIGMVELTLKSKELSLMTFDFIGIGLLTAVIYFLLGLPFVRLARYAERRLSGTLTKRPGLLQRWLARGKLRSV